MVVGPAGHRCRLRSPSRVQRHTNRALKRSAHRTSSARSRWIAISRPPPEPPRQEARKTTRPVSFLCGSGRLSLRRTTGTKRGARAVAVHTRVARGARQQLPRDRAAATRDFLAVIEPTTGPMETARRVADLARASSGSRRVAAVANMLRGEGDRVAIRRSATPPARADRRGAMGRVIARGGACGWHTAGS